MFIPDFEEQQPQSPLPTPSPSEDLETGVWGGTWLAGTLGVTYLVRLLPVIQPTFLALAISASLGLAALGYFRQKVRPYVLACAIVAGLILGHWDTFGNLGRRLAGAEQPISQPSTNRPLQK